MITELLRLCKLWLSAGWRRTAIVNTILIWILSIVLLLLFCISRIGFKHESTGTSEIYKGSCSHSSKVDIALHLVINILGTLILSSSNFFMQILTAPTRDVIDKGHSRGEYLEVGVPSLHNLTRSFSSATKAFFWLLLSLSSIPIHLFLNASIYTVNVSTENCFAVATEEFVHGAAFEAPGVGASSYQWKHPENVFTASSGFDHPDRFMEEVAANATAWSNMSFSACMDIYNDPRQALRNHRNAVMIVQEPGNSSTKGWRTSEVRSNLSPSNRSDTVNSLFLMSGMWLTDDYIQYSEANVGIGGPLTEKDKLSSHLRLDPSTGIMKTNFTSGPDELEALYCLVEPIKEACGVRVSNVALLVSWIFTALKALVCLGVVIKFRHENPLVTPGEAIDSFINAPDALTVGLCWVGASGDEEPWDERLRQRGTGMKEWRSKARKLGCAVPRGLWISSYVLFAAFLGIGIGLLGEGSRRQPITKSTFGPTSQTLGHNINAGPDRSDDMGDIHRALFANLPHLALALSYFAYNNIMTRMLSERELSEFARHFVPLRVSAPRGSQQGTHRLQLPYIWSIPLVGMSGILHWLLSNCLFPKVNIGYEAYPPYGKSSWSGRGLGYSTLATLITIVISFCAILIPIFVGRRKLSKDMVIFAGNSVVLSAACHVLRLQTEKQEGDADTALMQRGQARESDIAARKLRWGVVLPYQDGRPGHLAFGVAEQYLGPPQDTHYYAGAHH